MHPRLPRKNVIAMMSDEMEKECKDFFTNCVVAKDKDAIMKKLQETVDYRKNMMHAFADDFENIFNFYFASPDLVYNT